MWCHNVTMMLHVMSYIMMISAIYNDSTDGAMCYYHVSPTDKSTRLYVQAKHSVEDGLPVGKNFFCFKIGLNIFVTGYIG